VRLAGCEVMVGALLTVRVATLLVTLPTLLVIFTVYEPRCCCFDIADGVACASRACDRRTVQVPLVSRGWVAGCCNSEHRRRPAVTVRLAGCVVMVGALLTVRVATTAGDVADTVGDLYRVLSAVAAALNIADRVV